MCDKTFVIESAQDGPTVQDVSEGRIDDPVKSKVANDNAKNLPKVSTNDVSDGASTVGEFDSTTSSMLRAVIEAYEANPSPKTPVSSTEPVEFSFGSTKSSENQAFYSAVDLSEISDVQPQTPAGNVCDSESFPKFLLESPDCDLLAAVEMGSFSCDSFPEFMLETMNGDLVAAVNISCGSQASCEVLEVEDVCEKTADVKNPVVMGSGKDWLLEGHSTGVKLDSLTDAENEKEKVVEKVDTSVSARIGTNGWQIGPEFPSRGQLSLAMMLSNLIRWYRSSNTARYSMILHASHPSTTSLGMSMRELSLTQRYQPLGTQVQMFLSFLIFPLLSLFLDAQMMPWWSPLFQKHL